MGDEVKVEGVSEDLAKLLTPIVLGFLESNKAVYRANTPMPERLAFPIGWRMVERCVPGQVLATIKGMINKGMVFVVAPSAESKP